MPTFSIAHGGGLFAAVERAEQKRMAGLLADLSKQLSALREARPERDLLDCREASAALCVSGRTLRREVEAGRIRCVRIGRRLLFDPADVARFVAARKE
jgi:excisionase family DNA binding protein